MTTTKPEPAKLSKHDAIDQLAAFFEDQRDGQCAIDLAEVAKEVRAHNKGGSVSLTIKLAPIGKVDSALEVTDDVKAKPPTAPKSASILFVDSLGGLGKEHPSQRTLPGVPRTPLQEASLVGFDDPIDACDERDPVGRMLARALDHIAVLESERDCWENEASQASEIASELRARVAELESEARIVEVPAGEVRVLAVRHVRHPHPRHP